MGDLKSFQKRYLALRQSMLDDGIRRELPIHSDDFRVLTERLTCEGTSFVKVTLPLLGKALDLGLVSGHFMCPAHFRVRRNTSLPSFMYACFACIFEDDGSLMSNPNVNAIQFMRQFLLFDSKLKYEPTTKMRELTVDEFANRMYSLRKVRIDPSDPVLQGAKMLLGMVLSGLDLTNITPGHGPGAVAERLDKFARWDFVSWPTKAERFYPYLGYGTHSLKALLERGRNIRYDRTVMTRCCLVPKDFKGPRLISAEHVVNQYLQQGQMKALMQHISKNKLLRLSIRLRDQTFNQRAAQKAYSDDAATVDLSAASDTVSVPLVWHLLSGVPRLRRQLMCTRSDFMVFGDRKIKISAFAPMGSATCFPVETLIFWALTMSSVINASYHPVTNKRNRSLGEISRCIRVFGDDIIIPRYALQVLVGTLNRVGCSVNESKTCYKTPFRESCGSEWYGSYDVSIERNRSYDYVKHEVITHPVLCDLQRKFFARGYFNTAALLSEFCNSICKTPSLAISLFADKGVLEKYLDPSLSINRRVNLHSFNAMFDGITDLFDRERMSIDRFGCTLGFDTSIPTGCKIRYNQRYQRYECRLPVLFQKSRQWVTGGYPRLLARLLGDQTDRIAMRDLRVKMAWSFLPITNHFHDSSK